MNSECDPKPSEADGVRGCHRGNEGSPMRLDLRH
jgi:hypothetical protein